MAQPFIISTVADAVRDIPGLASMRVLDLSCGEGAILEALAGSGARVEGTHYREDDYVIREARPVLSQIPVHRGVALDRPLPFEDASYDVVILTEVIEHLPNHFLIIAEISRILRPDGWLFLTTPNVHRLHSRLKFLFTGTHKLIRRRIGWDHDASRLYEYHINPVSFPVLHTLFRLHGLEMAHLGHTRVKMKHLYLLLLYPLVALRSFVEALAKNENSAHAEGEADLFRKLTGSALLLSEQLFVIGRKR